ncbi:major facilitator superfamily transporter protein [Colletotrichum graminicola M1.001]|uniref:Major facilitator superfamily transporter protein n=1 Tax=Colletotrichum graminicola (strain M1.001 / M2 / FGSC 10212) TaxID=645133 RepID=E3QMY7_COLGM|nr:major facilitator superfamily transporter protein [Colletotrichum graminicola M1.001]EFQ32225.1 major facilitator superfamily transporter protein [Colletotrichum graminicola M1.001]
MLSKTFLFSLDNIIVANIQPAIINDFGRLELLSWIGTGFALGTIFILLWGKVYGVFNIKWVYIFNIFLFEVPNQLLTLWALDRRRLCRKQCHLEMGKFFSTLPFSSCHATQVLTSGGQGFYVNLPVGAAFAPAYFLLFPSVDPHPTKTLAEKLRLIDWVNSIIFIAGSACLTVVLTFGGVIYPFRSATVIALWIVTGVLLIAFVVLLKLNPLVSKENRLLPLHFFKQPILINMQLQVLLSSGIVLAMTYYVPLYFQFIKDDGALDAGVRLLPLIMFMVFASMVNGFLMPRYGMIPVWYIGGSSLTLIGTALMYTVNDTTANANIYGYNILVGAGTGCYIVAGFAIVQSLVPVHDIANAVGAMTISQDLGMVLFLAISGSLFHNIAVQKVGDALPAFPHAEIGNLIAGTSSSAFQELTDAEKALVIPEIASAMTSIWAFFLAAAALSVVCSVPLLKAKLGGGKIAPVAAA